MKDSHYHRFLRVTAIVFAFVLIFDSGIVNESTARLADGTQAYLATAIGVGARVQPTELNQWTAELTSRERELEAREAALREREIDVTLNNGSVTASDYSTYILASILFILLLLILLNYTLDYLRMKEGQFRRSSEQTV
jgi:hypothetical protein